MSEWTTVVGEVRGRRVAPVMQSARTLTSRESPDPALLYTGVFTVMQTKHPIGILGATGMVGQRFIQLLENHPWFEIAWLAASDRSSGKTYGEAAKWRLDTPLPERIARMTGLAGRAAKARPRSSSPSVDAAIAREMEPNFANAGCAVALQLQRLPHGAQRAAGHSRSERRTPAPDRRAAVAQASRAATWSPIPTAPPSAWCMALKPIEERFGIEQIFVTTMQAVSGAGYPGVASMDILDNVVPYIGSEEEKMEAETLKLLGTLEGHAVTPLRCEDERQLQPRRRWSTATPRACRIKLAQARPRVKRLLAAWAEFQPLAGQRSAHRARAARRVGSAARPPAAAPRPQSRQRHGGHRRPPAPLRPARLEVHRALAQHDSRRSRRRHPERRTAGEPGQAGTRGCCTR